jgi:hypothetical protein
VCLLTGTANQYNDRCPCAHPVCGSQQAKTIALKSHAGNATDQPPNSPEGKLFDFTATTSNRLLCAHSDCRSQQAKTIALKSHAGNATDQPPNSPEGKLFDFTVTDDWPSLLCSSGLAISASRDRRTEITRWRNCNRQNSKTELGSHDSANPPSIALIRFVDLSKPRPSHRNHTLKFGTTNQPPNSPEGKLFGFTAATAALLCDCSVWQLQRTTITSLNAHAKGQMSWLVNSYGCPKILQQPTLSFALKQLDSSSKLKPSPHCHTPENAATNSTSRSS